MCSADVLASCLLQSPPSPPISGPEEISASWHPIVTSAKYLGGESPMCLQFVLVESPLLPKILGSRDFPKIFFSKYTEGRITPRISVIFFSSLSSRSYLRNFPPFFSSLGDLIHLRASATICVTQSLPGTCLRHPHPSRAPALHFWPPTRHLCLKDLQSPQTSVIIWNQWDHFPSPEPASPRVSASVNITTIFPV